MLYKQYGKFDVTKLKTITSMEAVMKYHIWEQEACLRLCVKQSIKTGASPYAESVMFLDCFC